MPDFKVIAKSSKIVLESYPSERNWASFQINIYTLYLWMNVTQCS